MEFPENLKYTNDHEWIKVDGDIGTIGITDYAQSELGDIVFVEFPQSGDAFDKEDTFGTIEAVKTVSDLLMPVGGEVTEINSSLEDAPETINSDAYGAGWLIKIKIADPAELEGLMDAEAYKGVVAV